MRYLLVLLLAATLASCALEPRTRTLGPNLDVTRAETASEARQSSNATAETSDIGAIDTDSVLKAMDERSRAFNERLKTIMAGTDKADVRVKTSTVTGKAGERLERISIDLYDAPVLDVVDLIMEVLEEDYVVQGGISGTVSLHIEEQYDRAQLLDLAMGILRMHSATMIRQGDVWEILPLAQAPLALAGKDIILPEEGLAPARGQVIQGFTLEFISAAELVKVITPYLTQGALVYGNEDRGVLLVCDYPHTLTKVEKLIEIFDESVFADLKIRTYNLAYVQASDILPELEALAESTGLSKQAGPATISFLALERLNMVCALSRKDNVLDFVEAWIHELDRETPVYLADGDQESIFVYYVQNADASEIVSALGGVFGTVSEKKDVEEMTIGQQLAENEKLAKAQQTTGETAGISAALTDTATFVVDETTNSILTRANPSDYRMIEKLIKKLDVYPKQVLIDVVIAEVSLDESNQLGVEWQYLLDLDKNAQGSVTVDSGLGVVGSGGSAAGSGLSLLVAGTRFTGALQAFAGANNVRILSSPHIMASNHKSASINVGEDVPIVTATTRTIDSGAITTDSTVQYREAGIILEVTPHINEVGLVRLEVNQEVSEVSSRVVQGVTSPVFSNRVADSSITVQDGQTAVIGGLITQTESDGASGLPFLRRAPLLKYLFGTESNSYRSTELLIFITPHVIHNRTDQEVLSRDLINRLAEIKAMMY